MSCSMIYTGNYKLGLGSRQISDIIIEEFCKNDSYIIQILQRFYIGYGFCLFISHINSYFISSAESLYPTPRIVSIYS